MSLRDRVMESSAPWKLNECVQAAKKKWGPAWSLLGENQRAAEVALAACELMSSQSNPAPLGEKFASLAEAVVRMAQ